MAYTWIEPCGVDRGHRIMRRECQLAHRRFNADHSLAAITRTSPPYSGMACDPRSGHRVRLWLTVSSPQRPVTLPRLGVRYCLKRLASGATVIASGDENSPQALEVPHVAVEGEQSQENDEVLEDVDSRIQASVRQTQNRKQKWRARSSYALETK
jgi:hypothetical protein